MTTVVARVLKLYPELGCVRLKLQHPSPMEKDFVPVLQPMRGLYQLPREDDLVLAVEVDGQGFVCVGGWLDPISLQAQRLQQDVPSDTRFPHANKLRLGGVLDLDEVKALHGSR